VPKKRTARNEGPPASPVALRRSTASILTPTIDFLSVGGLSLLVMVPLLLSGRSDLVLIGAGAQAWLATLINMPHFMASYRLVYGSKKMIREHKWASIYLPLILLTYLVIAIWQARESQLMGYALITVSSLYLAWHYTGQVWGMMASFAFLAGMSFDGTERRLIRTSLRILLAWHLTWFLFTQLRDPTPVLWLYRVASAATLLAFGLGAGGLWKMWRRTGRVPPPLALVAWIAIFVWYAVMARDPKALFWVQIAHAIQYLAFPVRMEINKSRAEPQTSPSRVALHLLLYGVLLLGVSFVVAQVVPMSLMGVIGKAFGEEPARAAPILVLMFINIHHYFTDGVLWKISNPDVRKELFAHVRSA
jgi:hypothetical protein